VRPLKTAARCCGARSSRNTASVIRSYASQGFSGRHQGVQRESRCCASVASTTRWVIASKSLANCPIHCDALAERVARGDVSDPTSLRKAEHLDLAQRWMMGQTDRRLVRRTPDSSGVTEYQRRRRRREHRPNGSDPLAPARRCRDDRRASGSPRNQSDIGERVAKGRHRHWHRKPARSARAPRTRVIVYRHSRGGALCVRHRQHRINQITNYHEEGSLEKYVDTLIEMVRADALAVHLNYLEEMIQPEGQTTARGAIQALETVVQLSPVPIIAKETGGGLSGEVARILKDIGISVLDVGGRGGTSFAAIEAERSRARGMSDEASSAHHLRRGGSPPP